MFFQATRPGAPTVGLGVLLLLSLTYILTTSWPGSRARAPHSPVGSTPVEPGNLLYPQVVVTGDSIAERSFENGPGYGSTLVSMVRIFVGESHRLSFLCLIRPWISMPDVWMFSTEASVASKFLQSGYTSSDTVSMTLHRLQQLSTALTEIQGGYAVHQREAFCD